MWLLDLFRWLSSLLSKTQSVPTENTPAQPAGDNPMPIQGKNKALLVGVNKYAVPNADLNGCVNDVEGAWDMLTNRFGYKADDVRVLTDERATKQSILERLEWLVGTAEAGDRLYFHFSGHGSQIRDRNDDELNDHLDELICPHDLDWDDPLTDDILAGYFRRVPEGAFLIFVCDSCHSGSIDRGIMPPGNPHETKARFLPPPMDISLRSRGRELTNHPMGRRHLPGNGNFHYIEQRHLLLSGCKDEQTSADAYIGGKYQGALTANLLAAIEKDDKRDWLTIHKEVVETLDKDGYTQIPQLTGPSSVLSARIFG
jgi:hypothetical protein